MPKLREIPHRSDLAETPEYPESPFPPEVQDTPETPDNLRAQLQASRAQCAAMAAEQESFFRAVSHDLRAPLRHFLAFGQLVREALQEPDGVAEAAGYLDTMDQSARQMGRMIDALAELARIARVEAVSLPVDMAAVIAEAQQLLQPACAGRDLVWQTATGAPWPVVEADPALLRTAWLQLLGNAVKFTRSKPQAVIAVGWQIESDNQVAITLQDNGAGFNPAMSGQLFGVFQRLHRESEFAGIGAGLAVAQRAIHRLGGTVALTAAVQQGCTVVVRLPLWRDGISHANA